MHSLIKILLLLFILMSFCTIKATAQKKVLGLPYKYKHVIDILDNESQYQELLKKTSAKQRSKNIPWLVISDRDNNQTYSKPETIDANKFKTIHFKETYYVIDETEEWLKIVKAQVDELKIKRFQEDYGWIPKKKMLLWKRSLCSDYKINKKTFLANKASDVIREWAINKVPKV